MNFSQSPAKYGHASMKIRSMRLNFFDEVKKIVSRIDPRERSERDRKGRFPGA